MDTNTTVSHCQQANETYGEARQIFENSTTMEEVLKYQIIETIEVNYIAKLRKKYAGFMRVIIYISGLPSIGNIWEIYRNGPQRKPEEIQ